MNHLTREQKRAVAEASWAEWGDLPMPEDTDEATERIVILLTLRMWTWRYARF